MNEKRQQAIEMLEKYCTKALLREQEAIIGAMDYIAYSDDCFERQKQDGAINITAGALVVNPVGDKVLLMKHKKLGRWLQMGGHVENGDSPKETALKEVQEETGLEKLKFLDDLPLEVAMFTYGPGEFPYACTMLDFRFLLCAEEPEKAKLAEPQSAEDLRWFTQEEALQKATENSDEGTLNLLKKWQAWQQA